MAEAMAEAMAMAEAGFNHGGGVNHGGGGGQSRWRKWSIMVEEVDGGEVMAKDAR
jgi:hypothetical protein